MQTLILVVFVFSAIAIIGLVLIQHGKGADAGAAFGGGGASGSVFGARGSASFLTKLTAGLAVVFFILSIVLAHQSRNLIQSSNSLIKDDVVAPASAESEKGVPEPVESGANTKVDNGDGIPAANE